MFIQLFKRKHLLVAFTQNNESFICLQNIDGIEVHTSAGSDKYREKRKTKIVHLILCLELHKKGLYFDSLYIDLIIICCASIKYIHYLCIKYKEQKNKEKTF